MPTLHIPYKQQHLVSDHGSSKKAKIILVDDSVDEILLIETFIENAGPYQVATAQDGHEGLELLLARGWQLALVDLTLPGPDGIELIQQAKEEYPELQIMAVTVFTSSLMIDGSFRAGADYVLNKPVARDDILSKIREFVTLKGEGVPGEAAADATATGHVPTVEAVLETWRCVAGVSSLSTEPKAIRS
jgi:two-component system response regulator HydG